MRRSAGVLTLILLNITLVEVYVTLNDADIGIKGVKIQDQKIKQ